MSIDDIPRPSPSPVPFSVEHWRAVLHDAVDQVLDEILDAAEDEWSDRLDDALADDDPRGDLLYDDLLYDDLLSDDLLAGDCPPDDAGEADEPPGDPPSDAEIAALGTQLRESLAEAILLGTRFWGCDGTLRCTGQWVLRSRLPVDRVLGAYRRDGVDCDCAVLHTVLGRPGVTRCGRASPAR